MADSEFFFCGKPVHFVGEKIHIGPEEERKTMVDAFAKFMSHPITIVDCLMEEVKFEVRRNRAAKGLPND